MIVVVSEYKEECEIEESNSCCDHASADCETDETQDDEFRPPESGVAS